MSTINVEELTHDKIQAEIARIFTENDKMRAEINVMTTKTTAEIEKMRTENRWYPAIVGSTVTLAIVAVTKLYL